MEIRDETDRDVSAISALTTQAFLSAAHAGGDEAAIVEGLRQAHALRLSLVAEEAGLLIGHVAASNILIDDKPGWVGLGPVSVIPPRQGEGVGSALMHAALDRLNADGADGAVLVGDPGFYERFGFASHPGLTYGGLPAEYIMALSFTGTVPLGAIRYHEAFGAGGWR